MGANKRSKVFAETRRRRVIGWSRPRCYKLIVSPLPVSLWTLSIQVYLSNHRESMRERPSSHPLRLDEDWEATTCETETRGTCLETQRFCDKELTRFIAAYRDERTALKRLHSIVRPVVLVNVLSPTRGITAHTPPRTARSLPGTFSNRTTASTVSALV